MTNDICEQARIAYQAGIDPADYAEAELTGLIGVHIELASMLADFGVDAPAGALTVGAMARRILGSFMDAGWQPPEVAR